jgi:hypothetical protein
LISQVVWVSIKEEALVVEEQSVLVDLAGTIMGGVGSEEVVIEWA